MIRRLNSITTLLATLFALCWSGTAFAAVKIHFHSFNGSVLFGRYPHAFIVLEGTLESTGETISENYGFTAKKVSPAILNGPVYHDISIEKPKYLKKTNRHFSLTLTDAQYRQIVAEMNKWKNAPGKFYDLDKRNCIHFVGRMAEIVGLKIEYPDKMLRRPKKWLNHITSLNPKLGAKTIK
ncbi:hypothetical protein [Erythrobacter sp. YT30]|uniref:hypothetical protein n=1 Tax=Erythrobacter sp. YT30 TaxID=1735012 RepID=UPI00076BD54B|nr:hypothetical protein [Erythrobacter sp. YT30]KWV91648.1 hypothetical protein AUC45_10560 [Erythrobacter sp. YT30]